MNNNKTAGLAVRSLGIGVHKRVDAVAVCGWPEAGDGFSAILWINWLNEQWVTLSSPERQATLQMLRELALAELAAFQRLARLEASAWQAPTCQVLCAGLEAEDSFGKLGGQRPGAWGLCDSALLYLPRVVARSTAHASRHEDGGVEEGLVSMRALGDSSWHAEFIARRAAERGWHRLWVDGSESFVRQLMMAADRRGIAVRELEAKVCLAG